MYEFYQEQILETSLPDIWQFVSHPANLNIITPPELDFSIVSDIPEQIYPGLLIQYKVRLPLLRNSDWITEIKYVIPKKQFVDEQRIGPYAFWYHYHGLQETSEGIKMTDRVNYLPPYGILGIAANALFIRKKLDSIFRYRYDKLNQLFNN